MAIMAMIMAIIGSDNGHNGLAIIAIIMAIIMARMAMIIAIMAMIHGQS